MCPNSTNPERFEVVDGDKIYGSTTPTPFVIQEAFTFSLGLFSKNVTIDASLANTTIAPKYSVVPTIVLSATASQRLACFSVLQELVVFSRALIVATLSCVACLACMKVAPLALEKETIVKASTIGNSSKSEPTSFATGLGLFGGVEKGCSIQDAPECGCPTLKGSKAPSYTKCCLEKTFVYWENPRRLFQNVEKLQPKPSNEPINKSIPLNRAWFSIMATWVPIVGGIFRRPSPKDGPLKSRSSSYTSVS